MGAKKKADVRRDLIREWLGENAGDLPTKMVSSLMRLAELDGVECPKRNLDWIRFLGISSPTYYHWLYRHNFVELRNKILRHLASWFGEPYLYEQALADLREGKPRLYMEMTRQDREIAAQSGGPSLVIPLDHLGAIAILGKALVESALVPRPQLPESTGETIEAESPIRSIMSTSPQGGPTQ